MKIATNKGDLPIRYNLNALRKIGDDFGINMNEVFSLSLADRPMDDIFKFVLHGFVEGARLDKEECKVSTLDDIGDILDDRPLILDEAIKAFAEDMQDIAKKREEGKKK